MYEHGDGVERSAGEAAALYYKAGQAYLRDGKKEAAVSCCSDIKRAAPESKLAQELLAEIESEKPRVNSTDTWEGAAESTAAEVRP